MDTIVMIDGRIRFFQTEWTELMKSNVLDAGGDFLIGIESAIGASPISAFSFLQLHPNDPHLYNHVNSVKFCPFCLKRIDI
jgi:hypothetical protein